MKLLCANPFVAVVDDMFTVDEANHIIGLGQEKLEKATVVNAKGGRREDAKFRSNLSAPLETWNDEVLTNLAVKISEFVRLPPENSEPCQLLKYSGKQEYVPHPDAFEMSVGGQEQLAKGGQRLFTTLCYLNDVEAGGETEFPKLKFKVAPKLGRVLIFGNTRLGTAEAHPHSTHAGLPVKKGEKYALTFWWRQLAYHVQREFPAESGDMRTID